MTDRTPRPCLHARARHEHGTALAFAKDGCRCLPCARAYRRKSKETAYRTVTGSHTYVDAERARAHVRGLLATLTVGQIEQRSGVHRTAVRVLVGDFPGRPASRRVTRTTEAALLAVRPDRVGTEAHGWVDGTGTRRRFRALVALGWPARTLAVRCGATSNVAHRLTSDAFPLGTLVTVATRDAVRRLYDELSVTLPPPSRAVTRARKRAAARGWVGPLAWDDDAIDDPAARPDAGRTRDGSEQLLDDVAVHRAMRGDRTVRLRKAERAEVIRRLVELGLNDQQIERRTGISSRTAWRARHADEVGA